MSIETWQPESNPSSTDQEKLIQETQLFISNISVVLETFTFETLIQDIDSLIQNLSDDDLIVCQKIMTSNLCQDDWQVITQSSAENTSVLRSLIFFFTRLESKQSRFFAGDRSPVITLNKLLKAFGHKLDRQSLLWIRANTQNKFLPNGPITL